MYKADFKVTKMKIDKDSEDGLNLLVNKYLYTKDLFDFIKNYKELKIDSRFKGSHLDFYNATYLVYLRSFIIELTSIININKKYYPDDVCIDKLISNVNITNCNESNDIQIGDKIFNNYQMNFQKLFDNIVARYNTYVDSHEKSINNMKDIRNKLIAHFTTKTYGDYDYIDLDFIEELMNEVEVLIYELYRLVHSSMISFMPRLHFGFKHSLQLVSKGISAYEQLSKIGK